MSLKLPAPTIKTKKTSEFDRTTGNQEFTTDAASFADLDSISDTPAPETSSRSLGPRGASPAPETSSRSLGPRGASPARLELDTSTCPRQDTRDCPKRDSTDYLTHSDDGSINNRLNTQQTSCVLGARRTSISDDAQDDLEDMMDASPEELYELLASDPEHYFKLIQTYTQEPYNLPQRCRCLISRNQNHTLNIKFRILPDDRWTEIGHFQDMSDREIYEDFTSHVEALLKRSTAVVEQSRRPHLITEMGTANDISSKEYQGKVNRQIPKPDQDLLKKKFGNQTTQQADRLRDAFKDSISDKTKLDRNREEHESAPRLNNNNSFSLSKIPQNYKKFPPKEVDESVDSESFEKASWKTAKSIDRSGGLKSPTTVKSRDLEIPESIESSIVAYKQQLIERLNEKINRHEQTSVDDPQHISRFNHSRGFSTQTELFRELKSLSSECPEALRISFNRLQKSLATPQNYEFYHKVLALAQKAPAELQPSFQGFLSQVLVTPNESWEFDRTTERAGSNLRREYNHHELIEILGLDEKDRQLLEEHKIDLTTLE